MLIFAQSQISCGQVGPGEVVDAIQRKSAAGCAFDFNQIDIEFRQHKPCRELAGILLGLRVAA